MDDVGSHRFIAEEEFWTLIRSLFSEKYLQRYLLGDRDRLDYHDWLEYLNLTWKVITSTDHKEYKRNVEAYEILKSNLKEIYKLDDVTLTYKLELEKEELGTCGSIQASSWRRKTISGMTRSVRRSAGWSERSRTATIK